MQAQTQPFEQFKEFYSAIPLSTTVRLFRITVIASDG
jgi:hypothetical protein